MLLVEARLGRSPIHGWGVFARQRIPAGSRTWEFVPGVDQLIDPAAVEGAREDLRNLLVHYTQGTNLPDGGHDVALRGIEAGEELTVDYREFEDAALMARIEGGARPSVP